MYTSHFMPFDYLCEFNILHAGWFTYFVFTLTLGIYKPFPYSTLVLLN